MEITVVVCTWKRASMLRQTLEHLVRVESPDAQWEVLAVDNNSSDETPEVAASFERLLPLRVVRESKAGLSNARAAGVGLLSGPDTWVPSFAHLAAVLGQWVGYRANRAGQE